MAAKKSQHQQPVEQLQDDSVAAVSGNGNVIEFDPNVKNLGMNDRGVQTAEATAGTTVVAEALFEARDELHKMLGGIEAVASAIVRGADANAGLGAENIQGIGVGIRSTAHGYTGELAVKVYVTEKAPLSRVDRSFVVPAEINGYPTDVEEVGEFNAFVYSSRFPRAVPCGVSCGEVEITAGAIGCLVVLNNNRLCVLSNNHVLANLNAAPLGSPIVQPGTVDGGNLPDDRIGVLERFVPIQFPGPNLIDCAAAWTAFSLVRPQHVTYQLNPAPIAPSLNLSVLKNGRTTQATMGMITGIGVNAVQVNYGGGRVGVFNNQLIIQGIAGRPFSAGGDSGSLIVSANSRQPVALLFAGSATHTIANPIGEVMSQLGINRFVGG